MYISNKYQDWEADLRTTFEEETVMFNLLPEGWVKTFVPQMKDQLFKALGSYVDDFVLLDVKEKYGQIRMYWTWKTIEHSVSEVNDLIEIQKEIEDIIFYYENVSENTCAFCGNKTNYFSKRYGVPMCEVCEKKNVE